MRQRYSADRSIREIGAEMGRSPSTVWRALNAAGVTMDKKSPLPAMRTREAAEAKAGALAALRAWCGENGANIGDIQGPRRAAPVVNVRHRAIVHLRDAGFSFPAIGAAVHRDHTTVIYAYGQRGLL